MCVCVCACAVCETARFSRDTLLAGLIDVGEHLPDGAAREVLAETGVETEFDSVLAFRHGHRGLFGKSDLFFVVRMRLKPGSDAFALRPQASVKRRGLSLNATHEAAPHSQFLRGSWQLERGRQA